MVFNYHVKQVGCHFMNKKINSFSKLFTPALSAVLFMILSGIFATSMHCLIRFATEEHHPFEVAFLEQYLYYLFFYQSF